MKPEFLIGNPVYFITTNVKYKTFLFGKIDKGEMILNEYGNIVRNRWLWIANQYPYVKLYAFIIMPNHVHGIIEINHKIQFTHYQPIAEQNESYDELIFENTINCLNVIESTAGRDPQLILNRKANKIKSLEELIGAFKTTSSKLIHQVGLVDFSWERSFHQSLINNKTEFITVTKYILNNPGRWKKKYN